MFDCHIHSRFSSDSNLEPESACLKSIELNLEGIAFTEHHDIDYPGDEFFEMEDLGQYDNAILQMKDKYKSKLKVLKGIELGLQPHVFKDYIEVLRNNHFDYVLASVHVIDGVDPYYKLYYDGKSKKEAYELYLRKILYVVKEFNDFDNLGHFEYVIRYASYDDRSLRYYDHKELFDEILRILISKGKGFEINTGSFRDIKGANTAQFDVNILKRYRELGGEMISIGSDAHTLEYIGYKHEYFKEILLETGYRHIVHFENRKPVFTKLV